MNQILVTEKLYITPELRRKKKMYKIQFFMSVLLVCLLFSYYIYAEYDRNKSEEVSQEILAGIQIPTEETIDGNVEDTTVKKYDGIIVVAIEDDEEDDNQIIKQSAAPASAMAQEYTTSDGTKYSIDATLNIPRLGINYPVLSDWSEELLKISVNK